MADRGTLGGSGRAASAQGARRAPRHGDFQTARQPAKTWPPMLLDLLEYALTPCSGPARALGFLKSSLQVQARFRRCHRAWEPHLARTRRVILEAAERCPQRRLAVILGAGLLHDVPLRELSEMFREVVLVDIVFPWASRVKVRRFPNVRLLAADVTATMDALPQAARDPAVPLPESKPMRFLDEPGLDLTVSVNLLSQLPFIPTSYLRHSRRPVDDAALACWSRHLQDAHLDYLRRLHGHVALITDTGGRHRDRSGVVRKEWDNLHGLTLPEGGERWEWELAPAPEADPHHDHVVNVIAYADWSKSARAGNAVGPAPAAGE